MKLYFSRGACALGPQIVLREAGLNFDLISVNLKEKTFSGGDFLNINPKGYVPVLQLDNGDILTECAVLLQYIADQAPDKKLMPAFGTMERYKAMEMLHYLATEIHKGFGVMFGALKAQEEISPRSIAAVKNRVQFLDEVLGKSNYLLGNSFSVADAYAFNLLNWTGILKLDISDFKNVSKFMETMKQRPSVIESLRAEGLL